MKKKLVFRALMGFPLGVFIGYMITIMISLGVGDGTYYSTPDLLKEVMPNEINAVILQAFLSGMLGLVCSCASLIWEIDKWSIAKQTGIYFLVLSGAMLPIAYICHWMEHSIRGMLIYIAVFAGIFLGVWILQYLIYKVRINKITSKFKE